MIKKLCVLMLAFCLSGCFAFRTTPTSRFYLLESPKNLQAVSLIKKNIAIQDVSVPEYVDRPQLVLKVPDTAELQIAEFDRWGSDFQTMIQTTLIEDLQRALPRSSVGRLLYGSNASYVVKIQIDTFSGTLDRVASLGGNFKILNLSGKILAERNFDLNRPIGRTYDSYATAQSALLAELAIQIAEVLSRLS
jgi:uncharacterized lipoprotein YmbA